jgi:hypothetical protein
MTKPLILATNFSLGRFRSETGNSQAVTTEWVDLVLEEFRWPPLDFSHLPDRLNATGWRSTSGSMVPAQVRSNSYRGTATNITC